VRIDEVPITPEKIVKALQAKAAGRAPRYGPSAFPDVAWPDPLRVPAPWDGGDGTASNDPRQRGTPTTKSESPEVVQP
jgi:hypothetical protein